MPHDVSLGLLNTWSAIVTLFLVMYVALDGFDLGVGILSLFQRDPAKQTLMIEGIGSVWDANETWLVLLGGVMFGAFPLFYASVAHTLYIPLFLMLFALMFRGAAFEYRLYADNPALWTALFGLGSLLAALAQGMAFGALAGGMPLSDGSVAVDPFAWVTPLAVLGALLVVATYILLGATYLIGKLDSDQSASARRWAWPAVFAAPLLFFLFLYLSGRAQPYLLERWAGNAPWFALFLLALFLSYVLMVRALYRGQFRAPFCWCVVSVVSAILGLAASHYPYLIPGALTLHVAASATHTLEFMLYAIGGLLPFMLAYNAYQYYVFRGPVRPGEHH